MRSFNAVPLITLILIAVFWPAAASADRAKLIETIVTAVTAVAEESYPEARIEVAEPTLPAFVLQQPCAAPEVKVENTPVLFRLPVAIRCPAAGSWSAFVTVDVSAWLPVPTACSNIGRGRRLSAADLCDREQNVASQSTQIITERTALIGLETRRSLTAGATFSHSVVGPPKLVSRGDTVRLVSGTNRFVIATQASALSDGRLGQQIRVQNLRSGKQLRAWVTGPGSVSTRAPAP